MHRLAKSRWKLRMGLRSVLSLNGLAVILLGLFPAA
jgi:hypothetical protein